MRHWYFGCFLIASGIVGCSTSETSVALTELDPNDNLASGEPACRGTSLDKEYFVVCHDNDLLVPVWVSYAIDSERLAGTAERYPAFYPDSELPVGARAENSDYSGSGYDRGHMAPAADFKRSDAAMEATFVLSNVAPQTAQLNRGPWLELEDGVRALVRDSVVAWVVTGNLFLDAQGRPASATERIGANQVGVPTHCFKLVLADSAAGKRQAFAFVLPNADVAGWSSAYQVTIADLERMAGLDFLAGLSAAEQDELESGIDTWAYGPGGP